MRVLIARPKKMSQLIYHLQVMMIDRGITLEDIYKNL